MAVVHPPRVAWLGARVFVAAANAETYWWLSEMLGRYLGLMFELYLTDTRRRLQRTGETYAEIGIWRTYLGDLLEDRPELQPVILQLIDETEARLPR
ncbi:hypothetical protein AB0K60_21410 [Thermopolyspora sp. NPDC052614]|uniref:hypothetical protein n=1 Tax=Thermopolyspora sp. NPDC052614 TaxID=3155682 RepID=UPI003434D3F2